jgi:tetratricopeptide (TPR) repeat protein
MLALAPDSSFSKESGGVRTPNRIIVELLDLVGKLQNYSLLLSDREKATVRAHSIVQEATRAAMTEDVCRVRLRSWHSALAPFSRSGSHPEDGASSEQWLSPVQVVADSNKPSSKGDRVAPVKSPTWRFGYKLLTHALAVCKHSRSFQIVTLDHVRLLRAAGNWVQTLGQLAEAERYFEEAIGQFEKFAADSRIPPTDRAYEIIGALHENLGTINRTRASGSERDAQQYRDKALDHLKKAEAIYTRIADAADSPSFGPHGWRTADPIQCQGCTYLHTRPPAIAQAEKLLRRASEIYRQLEQKGVDLGESHAIWNRMNIALLERSKGSELTGVKEKLNELLAGNRGGTEDWSGYSTEAILLWHLAKVHDDLNEHDKAKECRAKVAEILREIPMNYDCTLDIPGIRKELHCPLPGDEGNHAGGHDVGP